MEKLGCKTFSTLSLNNCLECNEDKVSFTYNNYCQLSEVEIANCSKYSADGKCEICENKVSYLANNKCVLGSIAKCIEYAPTSHKCLKCDTDLLTTTAYVPDSEAIDNSCVMANPNYHHSCQQVNSVEKKKCDMCIENYYPKINDFRNTRYCVTETYYEFGESPNVANCSTFDMQNLKCMICQTNEKGVYYYNKAGLCGTACQDNQSVQTYKITNNNITHRFSCETTPVFNINNYVPKFGIPCHLFEYEHTLNDFVCSGCKADEIAVMNWSMNASVGYLYSYKRTTGTGSFFSVFNRLTPVSHCLKKNYMATTSQKGTALTQPFSALSSEEPNVLNCRFLVETNNEVYQCGSCNFGYTGKVVRTLDNYSYMLEKCEILAECKTDIFLDGLGSLPGQLNISIYPIPIDYYISCHICKFTNKILIPTYGIVAVADIEVLSPPAKKLQIAPFGIPTSSNPSQSPYQVEAAGQTYQTTCQVPGLNQIEAFPSDCGIQELQVDKALNPYLIDTLDDKTNPICVACSPGYVPIQDGSIKKAIVKCTKIENCSSSTIFNKCSSCEAGFAIKDGSDFTICVVTPVRNCWIYSANLSVCIQCLDGYVPINGLCDFANMYKCEQRSTSFSAVTNLKGTLLNHT